MRRRGNGEGTIYLRKDGRWEAAYFGLDGKRKNLLRKTQAEARHALAEAIHARDQGRTMPSGRETLGEFLEVWLAITRANVRYVTWRRYRSLLRCHVIPELGNTQLMRLTPLQVQRVLNGMLDRGSSATSVRHAHAALRRALNAALDTDLVSRNVATRVKPPAIEHREMKLSTPIKPRSCSLLPRAMILRRCGCWL